MPRYQKAFEAAFFAIFLILYYAVLGERNPQHITLVEVLLYIWIAAFACDELGEFTDAGSLMYADFWNLWDVGIIGIGTAYLILRQSIPLQSECHWSSRSRNLRRHGSLTRSSMTQAL